MVGKATIDDLIAGSLNPFELFCIFNEIVDAGVEDNANASRIAYMIDQSQNIEPKIEAMIQSVINIQTAYAKALLVDRPALQKAQEASDVLIWIPYRRPGFGLAREVALALRANPHARLVILAKHGLITWGETDESCYASTMT